jgi:hypothetical protein
MNETICCCKRRAELLTQLIEWFHTEVASGRMGYMTVPHQTMWREIEAEHIRIVSVTP